MRKNKYYVIGVMSGTSLDGVDFVYTEFTKKEQWHYKIFFAETTKYSNFWLNQLKNLVNLKPEELKSIDKDYTLFLAQLLKDFLLKNNIKTIDSICSHGHTALHNPREGYTYQIGNLPILSKLLHKVVVCNFRLQDVKLGGEGAPLVPIGDKLLFPEYDFCLNLGGFANISMEENKERIAFDVCPVNIVLNYYSRSLGYDFDESGKIASMGKVNKDLLMRLNGLDFYKKPYPKSLGLEWVNANIFPLIKGFKIEVKDILATFCEHIAIQITSILNLKLQGKVLITGGGAYNTFLINRIEEHSKVNNYIPKQQLIEFKEALIFGFLGVLKLRNEINCLKSVTGASTNHSSGVIYQP